MSNSLDALRSKVQNILTQNFSVGLDKDGAFTLEYESAKAWVKCWEQEETGRVFVRVEAPLLWGVKPTPELFKHIALHSDDFVFGHLWCLEQPDGILILFTHTLLGEYLDDEELMGAVITVVTAGNDLDDDLQGMFGGKRYADHV